VLPLALCGLAAAGAYTWIAVAGLPLGSPIFFAAVAIAAVSYLAALLIARRARCTPAALIAVSLVTIAMRAAPVAVPVGGGSDMFRYVWDARVQRAGLSPYRVIPSDPAFDHLHTAETRKMNNVGIASPYPPGAQIFFRLATVFSESARAIKIVLVLCDLATAALLVLWLRRLDRNPLWAIVYAWNPLVVLEIAHSGHLDGAGMFLTALAAFALMNRRVALSVVALAGGIAIKFLPIVIVPLWWKRARVWHAALGAGALAAMYLAFTDFSGQTAPVGSVTNMVRAFRFNGPVFKLLAFLTTPWAATAIAVAAAMAAAWWIRRSRIAGDPAAFAWPMAAALVASPVVYPWYLLWLTPFFISALAWPLMVWSVMILTVYTVWHGLAAGGTWAVPAWMGFVEYGVLLAASAYALLHSRSGDVRCRSTSLDEASGRGMDSSG
jgi:hypothetical protein